jgi:hypothetical protein
MKTNIKPTVALWLASLLAVCLVLTACEKKSETPVITPAEKEASEKAAVAKALSDKTAVDKAAADKAAADKAAAENAAAEKAASEEAAVAKALSDKAAADKMAADKAAAEKAAADKIAADKAAADKAAADEKAHAAALPADLVVMKSELAQVLSQIDLTIAKLEVLSAATDRKQPSKDVIAAIDSLDTSTQAIKKRAQDMRDRGASYFEAWETQIKSTTTPEVAAIAVKRKDELAASYAEVLTSMQESRAAFDPLWTEMQSIRKVVDDGLTQQGQADFLAQIKAVKEMAVTLKSRVEATSAKLNQVSVIYTKP